MITINPVKSKSTDEYGKEIEVLSPESDIPVGYKVRFIAGVFQCIPQYEEWPIKAT
jgi:hypothetical protein